jgi:hypothetical protein
VGRVYRRVLFRLLRPYTVRQRELEVAVVEAIRDVQHEAALELRDVDRRLHDGLQRQIERLGRLQTQNHEILQRLEEFDARLAENEAEFKAAPLSQNQRFCGRPIRPVAKRSVTTATHARRR